MRRRKQAACRDEGAHRRPAPAEECRGAQQNDAGGQERNQDRVVEKIDGPHAAADAAHRRTCRAVRVPVGGKALHPVEGLGPTSLITRRVRATMPRMPTIRPAARTGREGRGPQGRGGPIPTRTPALPSESANASTSRPAKIGTSTSASVATIIPPTMTASSLRWRRQWRQRNESAARKGSARRFRWVITA